MNVLRGIFHFSLPPAVVKLTTTVSLVSCASVCVVFIFRVFPHSCQLRASVMREQFPWFLDPTEEELQRL